MALAFCGLLSPSLAVAEGSWIKVQQLPPEGIGTMLLLSDGTVMAQGVGGGSGTTNWYRLAAGSTGGYTNGTLNFVDPQTRQFPKRFYRATIFP